MKQLCLNDACSESVGVANTLCWSCQDRRQRLEAEFNQAVPILVLKVITDDRVLIRLHDIATRLGIPHPVVKATCLEGNIPIQASCHSRGPEERVARHAIPRLVAQLTAKGVQGVPRQSRPAIKKCLRPTAESVVGKPDSDNYIPGNKAERLVGLDHATLRLYGCEKKYFRTKVIAGVRHYEQGDLERFVRMVVAGTVAVTDETQSKIITTRARLTSRR